ncbi:thioredoxin [Coraliomargarita sp. W4R53]
MPRNIKDTQEFEAVLKQTDTIVAVDFWAPWCGPCQAFGPILDLASEQVGDQAEFIKLNVDELRDVAQKYGISSIPTVLYFRNGVEVHRATGIETTETIVSNIQEISLQKA